MLRPLDHGTLWFCDPRWLFTSSIQQRIQVVQPQLYLRRKTVLYVKGTPLLSFPLMSIHEILHHLHQHVFCIFRYSLLKFWRLSIQYFMLSGMAHKPLFLMEMQVIVRYGFWNSPRPWKQWLRFARVGVQSTGTWFSFVVCFTSNWANVGIRLGKSCHFLQLSVGQAPRLVNTSNHPEIL